AERYRAAQEIGSHELDRALSTIASAIDTSRTTGTPVVVFNPLAWERTDLVRLRLPGDGAGDWTVFDWRGREVPSQVVEAGRYARELLFVASGVPSLGYATFALKPQKAKPQATTLK